MTTFDNSLPPSRLLCGNDYGRCNVHISSKSDDRIRVVVFPFDLGIGLVSYDYFNATDTLTYRQKYHLIQDDQSCNFLYFVESRDLIGYCLDASQRLHARQIIIEYINLTLSSARTFDIYQHSVDITSLSNFLLFRGTDACFSNDGDHVLFLDNGSLVGHSFTDREITFRHHFGRGCTRLRRVNVRNVCKLVANCNDGAVLFVVQSQRSTNFTETDFGKVFFCSGDEFVGFKNETLSLYDGNKMQLSSLIFSVGDIHQGDCLRVNQDFMFIAALEDGRTILVNLSDSTHQQLGQGKRGILISSGVNGNFVIASTGNETAFYNLSLTCTEEHESVLLPTDFVLATFYVSNATGHCRCPVIKPTNEPTNNLPPSEAAPAIVAVVVAPVVLISIVLIIVFFVILYRVRKR